MSAISEIMTENHRQCDQLFSKAEALTAQENWEQARPAFDHFRNAMKHHFSMEEDVLFPALEQRTGQTTGPTQVMRMEHEQMRQLLSDMEEALAREDRDQYLGFAETLMITTQQHNMKEEQILYPMSDQAFSDDATEIIKRLESN